MSEEQVPEQQPEESKTQDFGIQIVVQMRRYPTGQSVGQFLSTVLPIDFFHINSCNYADTLNNFIASATRDMREAVKTQSQNGYKSWPLLKQLFDAISKSGVKKDEDQAS